MTTSEEESKEHPQILRLPFRFEEYRQKKIFVDCNYTINHEIYDCHKIILSRFSKLYLRYFIDHDENNVPIPFAEESFNFMVDFFYTGSIKFPLDSTDNLILYLAMSIIYEADTLYDIIMPIIEDFLNSKVEVIKVFNLTSQFKNIKLNVNALRDFPKIDDNLEKFFQKQTKFVPFIVQHFSELTKNSWDIFFKSVTPFLLSEILKEMHFSNEMNAQIIDKCIDTISDVTEKEKKYLQTVIDWDDNNAYLLFLNNKMEWVTPDISRSHIERILNARSVSSQAFLEMCHNMCLGNQSKNKINNWWTIQQTQFIKNSEEENEPSEVEAMHFIGSIGNQNDSYYNPISFELIHSDCSPNLPEDDFYGIDNILNDDPDSYYLSYPKEEEIQPYIQISFNKATFDVNRIEIESVPDRIAPNKVQFIFNDIPYGTAKMNNYLAELKTNEPVNVNKITIKMIDPESLPFRVRSLRVYGTFNKITYK